MSERTLTLQDATLVGVGAIVGGGILALGGHAIMLAGSWAIAAFALNGLVALATAGAFAELATRFPVSGGAYAYAKRVLGVRAAFGVGWFLWFAYIVAGVLYALGFGVFAVSILERIWPGVPSMATPALALVGVAGCAAVVRGSGGGGGQAATWGKVVVFGVLIVLGLVHIPFEDSGVTVERLTTPLSFTALAGAMGLTFIALQGFDAIATIAGQVKEPSRTLPRAMLGSIGIALLVYLPLLLVTIAAVDGGDPDALLADAARAYAGEVGWWLVAVAAVLAMLSALQANVLAASQIALAMAGDRTLPPTLAEPKNAISATAVVMAVTLLVVPDLGAAGAAASLVFLGMFASVLVMALLARRRLAPREGTFLLPVFPAVHMAAFVACCVLALFALATDLVAGGVAGIWMAFGALLYATVFASRAEVADAFAQAHDPELVQARGGESLVLVPVANPSRAGALVEVASAVAAPGVGEVLVLNVVAEPTREALQAGHEALMNALVRGAGQARMPQALTVFGSPPQDQILRVAKQHGCHVLVIGLARLDRIGQGTPLDHLVQQAKNDLLVLRAHEGFELASVRRILVPLGGRAAHDAVRARLLGALMRHGAQDVTYLSVQGADASEARVAKARRRLQERAQDEAPGARAEVVQAADPVATLVERAKDVDLVVLGMTKLGSGRSFGMFALRMAEQTDVALLVIGHG